MSILLMWSAFEECSREGGKVWLLAARQGFEPRYAAPEAAVLPLNERATTKLGFVAASLNRP